ncbi:IclR family transcriptional regulator [Egibacter rhizosphaerae]|uniref:Glycerol operon regulatory protein n=1 Tax=Egibacter rhizosphaerae TaxID=1670831 RepID=A0A411YIH5_9ACTN|nr:IclR family transcriptional regulator C-terminal domain-containing protein [Egibacter rhizosphaerae]QBI20997.1 IclR family transcriptional regulator [Egibacter rhizosphaerae]
MTSTPEETDPDGLPNPASADEPTDPEHPSGYVQSLARGLSVIRAFDADQPEMTLSDVARATGLTRAAARRFLITLVDLGYVRQRQGRFALTPRILELGYAYLSSLTLPELAHPHLERLASTVRESTSVSVLDGDEVVYVARVATSRIMTVRIDVGTRFPAHATSMGRVLLAHLSGEELDRRLVDTKLVPLTDRTITDPQRLRAELAAVREQGYALVDQELEEGLRSIAAPVRDGSGRVVAAANVSANATRTSVDEMRDRLLPALRDAAEAISHDLAVGAGGAQSTVGPHD